MRRPPAAASPRLLLPRERSELPQLARDEAVHPLRLRIGVNRRGGGVPPALLDRVFEMHFTTKERGRGSGLGLTLCQFLMTRFGGSIALRNVPGGAEVRLVFRRAQVQAPPAMPQRAPAAPVPGDAPVKASAAG